MLFSTPVYRIMGDSSFIVELGNDIDPEVNQRVRELFLTLAQNRIEGVRETVPTYRSLLILYDPLKISFSSLKARIKDLYEKIERVRIPEPKTVQVPVVYGGEYGPDLEWVAQYHKMGAEEVIQLHTGAIYRVYMIGFTPGYPYMGELPETLFTPRRKTPRTLIASGSVGIAQRQTGIYPVDSPGGWQIIGRTPLKLFNPTHSPPALLSMGDRVQFITIGKEEFEHWQQ